MATGTGGIFLALLLSGLTFWLMPDGIARGYTIIVLMTLYLIFYSFGPGIVVWLALSELLPNKIRSVGMSAALFLNSLASAVFATIFLSITEYIEYNGAFFVCAAFCLLYFFVAYLWMPETKGKSLEEIEKMMVKE